MALTETELAVLARIKAHMEAIGYVFTETAHEKIVVRPDGTVAVRATRDDVYLVPNNPKPDPPA